MTRNSGFDGGTGSSGGGTGGTGSGDDDTDDENTDDENIDDEDTDGDDSSTSENEEQQNENPEDNTLDLMNLKTSAESLIAEVEMALVANASSLSSSQKASLDVALNSLKSAIAGNSIDNINASMSLLQNEYSKI